MTLLTRWEPFREFSTMQGRMSRMNRLFRESYSPEVPEEASTTLIAEWHSGVARTLAVSAPL